MHVELLVRLGQCHGLCRECCSLKQHTGASCWWPFNRSRKSRHWRPLPFGSMSINHHYHCCTDPSSDDRVYSSSPTASHTEVFRSTDATRNLHLSICSTNDVCRFPGDLCSAKSNNVQCLVLLQRYVCRCRLRERDVHLFHVVNEERNKGKMFLESEYLEACSNSYFIPEWMNTYKEQQVSNDNERCEWMTWKNPARPFHSVSSSISNNLPFCHPTRLRP